MSHFTVLVAARGLLEEGNLADALQPFHEFECTGTNDQYVVEVDETDEARSSYETDANKFVRLQDGSFVDIYEGNSYNPIFMRDPTPEEVALIEKREFEGRSTTSGKKHRVFALPEGAEEVSRKVSDYLTFEDWAAGYYGREIVTNTDQVDTNSEHLGGYILKRDDEIRVINRTNPNRKWDWYQLGGRWNGMLIAKEGATSAVRGSPSWAGEASSNYDAMLKGDLDMDRMKQDAIEGRREAWGRSLEKIRAAGFESISSEEADVLRYKAMQAYDAHRKNWDELNRAERPNLYDYLKERIDEETYKVLAVVKDYFSSSISESGSHEKIEDWINDAPALSTYALLVDGEWIAHGEMGWFGFSDDTMDAKSWETLMSDKIASLPNDYGLAVVDCHI